MELDSDKATANCALNYFYDKNNKKREYEANEDQEEDDGSFYDINVSKILKIN
jgi:hypothetical protein